MRVQKLTAAALSKLDPQGWFYRPLTIRLPPDRQQLVFLGAPATGRLADSPEVETDAHGGATGSSRIADH
jgi:hypothetical protein